MTTKNIRVIFDTNVWVSFLIGKRLSFIKGYLINGQITMVTTNQLTEELVKVTSREKLKKYFPQESVLELVALIETIAEKVEITSVYFINRDPKDNFLLDLIHFSKADYLVTGDKDLLELNTFNTTIIISPSNFDVVLSKTTIDKS